MNSELILRFQEFSLFERPSIAHNRDELCSKILAFFSLSYTKRHAAAEQIVHVVRSLEAIDSEHILIPLTLGEIERMKVVTDGARKYFEKLSGYDLSTVSPAIRALVLSRRSLFDLIFSKFVPVKIEDLCIAYRLNNKDPLICALFASTLLQNEPLTSFHMLRNAYVEESHDPIIAMSYALQLAGFNPLVHASIQKANNIFLKAAKSSGQSRLYLGLAQGAEDPYVARRFYNRAIEALRHFCKIEPQHQEELWSSIALRARHCLSSAIPINTQQIQKELDMLSRQSVENMSTLLFVAESYTKSKEGFKTDYGQALSLCTRVIANANGDKETKREALVLSAMIYEKGGFGVLQDCDLALQIRSQLAARNGAKETGGAVSRLARPASIEMIEHDILHFLSLPYPAKISELFNIEKDVVWLLENSSSGSFAEFWSHMAFGDICFLKENIDKAIFHFAAAASIANSSLLKCEIATHPAYSIIIARVGFVLFNRKLKAESRKLFEAAHEIAKDDPFTLCCLSVVWQEEKISRSELLLQRAFDLDPENPFVAFHYALGHLQGTRKILKDEEKAKAILEKINSKTPGAICVNFLLGEIVRVTDPNQAFIYYNVAIESQAVLKNPYGLLSLVRRAQLLLEVPFFSRPRSEAYRDLQLVFEQTTDVDILYECALVYRAQKKDLEINKRYLRALYNKILQRAPGHKEAREELQTL